MVTEGNSSDEEAEEPSPRGEADPAINVDESSSSAAALLSDPAPPELEQLPKKEDAEPPSAPIFDEPFCVHISSSQNLLEDSPIEKIAPPAVLHQPDVTIIEPVELRTATPGEVDFLRRVSQLDATFPPPIRGEFQPSEFQRAVLDNMQQKRQKLGHKHGLSIMATAVGKVRQCAPHAAASHPRRVDRARHL